LKEECILAHDVGTTSDKAILVNLSGEIVSSAQENYDVQYPKPTWAEQSVETLWRAVCKTTRETLKKAGVSPEDVCGISFSAQFPSTILLDKEGKPLRPCIIWLDGRAESQAEWLQRTLGIEFIYERTGQVVCSKSVISRILWLKENEPTIFNKASKIIDLKDYIEYRLTGNFVTDWSCASQSAFFDIRRKEWVEELCETIELSVDKLPELHSSIDVIGEITDEGAKEIGLKKGTPVIAGGGDNACVAVGAGATREGGTHLCVSTSAWIGVSSEKFILDPKKRLFTICHIDPRKWLYNVGIDTAGNCLSWFINELGEGIIRRARERGVSPYRELDIEAEDADAGSMDLFFVPYLFGGRASVLDSDIRGGFIGLTLNHKRSHMARAILEGIAYHFRWLVEALETLGFKIEKLNMVGGGALSKIWSQIFADVISRPVDLLKYPLESGALGAAYTTAVGLKIIRDIEEVDDLVPKKMRITPNPANLTRYNRMYERFKALCLALTKFYQAT